MFTHHATLIENTNPQVAFARVLARDPTIWILDEATAHLDPKLDAELNSFAAQYASGKSLLIVAHRLSSVVSCRRILVLSDGEAVQYGNHSELISVPGLYRQLWDAQKELAFSRGNE